MDGLESGSEASTMAPLGPTSGSEAGAGESFNRLVCSRKVAITELPESRSLLDFVMVGVTLGRR
jgi:hypothetical protein